VPRDIVWLSKHPITSLLYLACLGVGASAVGSKAYDWESSLNAGLGIGTNCATFILPIYLCLAWGLAHDGRVEQSRLLAGWSADTQRLRMLASVCAVGVGAVLVAVGLAGGLAVVIQDPPPQLGVDIGLTRTGLRLVLVLLGAVVASVVVGFGRPVLAAVCAGSGIVLCHVLIQFTPDVVGQTGLKLLWPFTGATAISEAGANYSTNQGLVATGALFAWVLWALVRLSRWPVGAHVDARTPRARATHLASDPQIVVLGCLLVVAVVPGLIRVVLPVVPPSARPSMLLQRSQGGAPEQIAGEFFDDLQRGSVRDAQRRVTSTAPALVENLPRSFFVPGPSQSFQLERLIGIDRAEVTAYLVAGTYQVCMRNQQGIWRIESIGVTRC
jgi:hypothetical protein